MGKAKFSHFIKMPPEWPDYVRRDFESPTIELEMEFNTRAQMVSYANNLAKSTKLGSWKVNWTESEVDISQL